MNINRTTVYYHFESRDALLEAVKHWSAEQLAKGVNLASASDEPWEPGGPWQAQGQLLKTLTDLRDEIDWAGRDLKKFLTAHPAQADLAAKTASIETALTALQRDLAHPVPTDFVVRPAAAEAGK